MNLNKTFILGRVTSDIELKALPSGQSVANFSIATNRYWTDKNGDKQEEVQFHNMVAFGKTADTLSRYTGKGALLLVIGRNVTRTWEDRDTGKKMYRAEIHVEEFQLPPKALSGNDGSDRPQKKSTVDRTYETTDNYESAEGSLDNEDINPDDIPF